MNKKEATKKTKEFLDMIAYLFGRWMDERDYEDINDYLQVIQKVEPRAYEMTDDPFGVKINVDGTPIHFFVEIKGNNIIIGTRE